MGEDALQERRARLRAGNSQGPGRQPNAAAIASNRGVASWHLRGPGWVPGGPAAAPRARIRADGVLSGRPRFVTSNRRSRRAVAALSTLSWPDRAAPLTIGGRTRTWPRMTGSARQADDTHAHARRARARGCTPRPPFSRHAW